MGRLPAACGKPLVALALIAVLGACSSPSANSTPGPDAGTEPQDGVSSASPAAQADHGVQIADLWESLHDERIRQTYTDEEPDGSSFERFATDDTAVLLVGHVRAARSDVPTQFVDVEYWTEIDISPTGDSANIADCIIVAERPTGQSDAEPTVRSQVWTGTAIESDDGWVLDDISVGIDNCVPRELNDQLLDAYRAYHEAWTAAWDPPDPDHPQLDQTMTGERLTEIRQQLETDREAGVAFRDPHDPLNNAVVLELGIGTATVSDCHEADPGYGVFDVETGERLDDEIPPVEPGQLNLTSVDFVRSDQGVWQVERSGGLDDTNCEPGGTEYVVAP